MAEEKQTDSFDIPQIAENRSGYIFDFIGSDWEEVFNEKISREEFISRKKRIPLATEPLSDQQRAWYLATKDKLTHVLDLGPGELKKRLELPQKEYLITDDPSSTNPTELAMLKEYTSTIFLLPKDSQEMEIRKVVSPKFTHTALSGSIRDREEEQYIDALYAKMGRLDFLDGAATVIAYLEAPLDRLTANEKAVVNTLLANNILPIGQDRFGTLGVYSIDGKNST